MDGTEDPDRRIVVLIDMDCFYCQVEAKLDPSLKGQPIAVVQYNKFKGGGIIAVNYEARARGVTRHMRGDEALAKCPEIRLPSVPCKRGKADISKYREAGKEVAKVLADFTELLERASIDEAYLDITAEVDKEQHRYVSPDQLPNTHVIGYDSVGDFFSELRKGETPDEDRARRLLIGAVVVQKIRAAVFEKTGYTCSAGIAHNKITAKLVCGMNKPNKQTVLPDSSIPELYESLPIGKVRSLGGKFGENVCTKLKIEKMSQLLQYSEKQLQKLFDEKNGSWLYNIARGKDSDPVTPRFSPKSIGCCKKFPGKTAIVDLTSLMHWLKELGSEIEERLVTDSEENNRRPTQMVVSFTKMIDGKDVSCSRSVNMTRDEIFDGEKLAMNALTLIRKDSKPFCSSEIVTADGVEVVKVMLASRITFLGISVGKFEQDTGQGSDIQHFFEKMKASASTSNRPAEDVDSTDPPASSSTKSKGKKPQESFIMKYLKTSASTSDSPAEEKHEVHPLQIEENSSSSSELPSVISNTECVPKESFIMNYLKTFKKSEDPAAMHEDESSKDSDASIELEINRSLQLDDSDETRKEKIEKLRMSLVKHEESSDSETIECEQCNKSFAAKDFSTHQDYHLALSLRNVKEDRRKSLPSKLSRPKADGADIAVLFQNMKNSNEADADEDCTVCQECGKKVKIHETQEHSDHHQAVRLQKEINLELSKLPAPGKRKRSPNRKIDSYFK